ncbi:MAG: thiolase family protein [Acidimicrobiales bacterium]
MADLEPTDVVIVDAVRTATARRNGRLAGLHATDLLADTLLALIDRSPIDAADVDHVAAGCINQVGMQANNIARTSWLAAGLPLEVPASTTSVQCGSGQQANMWAQALIGSGMADIVIACGVESMTQVPLASNVPRDADGEAMYGERFTPRYEEFYDPTNQFQGGEMIAEAWDLDRAELDQFGLRSQQLAAVAWEEGRFDGQIVSLKAPVVDESGAVVDQVVHDRDEGLRDTTIEGLTNLHALAGPDGYHTAGTSSQIADAAGAVMLMSAAKAAEVGATPIARVVDSCLVGSDPVMMLTGPMPATRKLLADNGLTTDDIDIYEINEAFASVVVAWAKELEIEIDDRVNPNGGAIAIGHALGSTGPILITKTVHELQRSGGRYGLISMCCGGGLGTGTLVERV